jgi:hypothetical protein
MLVSACLGISSICAPAVLLRAAGPTTQPSPQTQPVKAESIRRWFDQLADADPAVREDAADNLMRLKRDDLPLLRSIVKNEIPLAPNQVDLLPGIVSQIFLSGEEYEVVPGAGFMGIRMFPVDIASASAPPQPAGVSAAQQTPAAQMPGGGNVGATQPSQPAAVPSPQHAPAPQAPGGDDGTAHPPQAAALPAPQHARAAPAPSPADDGAKPPSVGIRVENCIPGFCAGGVLHPGDIIVSLAGSSELGFPNSEVFSEGIRAFGPGATVRLQILRHGHLCDVALTLCPRPAATVAAEINPGPMLALTQERQQASERYWDENFAPMLKEEVSSTLPPSAAAKAP